jgi:hypothetical protein
MNYSIFLNTMRHYEYLAIAVGNLGTAGVRYARIRWGECIQVEQNVVMLFIVDLIL